MSYPIDDWLVPLDKDTMTKLLQLSIREYEISENSIRLQNIYATDIALGVHLLLDQEIVVRHQNSVKQILGHLLRTLGDLADINGCVLPIIGFIEVKNNDEEAKEAIQAIEQLAGDQDWHRGDFSLMLLNENPGQTIFKLLSCAATVWENVKPLEPLSQQEYAERIKEEREKGTYSKEHKSLLLVIESALRDNQTDELDYKLDSWLDEWFEEATKVMEVS